MQKRGDDMAQSPTSVADVRDVVDFHLRWREFRSIAVGAAGNTVLKPDERGVIEWLVALADRVGERDVQSHAASGGIQKAFDKGAADA